MKIDIADNVISIYAKTSEAGKAARQVCVFADNWNSILFSRFWSSKKSTFWSHAVWYLELLAKRANLSRYNIDESNLKVYCEWINLGNYWKERNFENQNFDRRRRTKRPSWGRRWSGQDCLQVCRYKRRMRKCNCADGLHHQKSTGHWHAFGKWSYRPLKLQNITRAKRAKSKDRLKPIVVAHWHHLATIASQHRQRPIKVNSRDQQNQTNSNVVGSFNLTKPDLRPAIGKQQNNQNGERRPRPQTGNAQRKVSFRA